MGAFWELFITYLQLVVRREQKNNNNDASSKQRSDTTNRGQTTKHPYSYSRVGSINRIIDPIIHLYKYHSERSGPFLFFFFCQFLNHNI